VGDGFNNIEANRETLTKWMGERNLEPTTDNFEIAFARTAALQLPATVSNRHRLVLLLLLQR